MTTMRNFFSRIKFLSIIPVLLLGGLAVWASDPYTVNYSVSNQQITAFSTCKSVTNNSATHLSEFVTTNLSGEWTSFYNSPPAGVSVGACALEALVIKSAQLPFGWGYLSCATNPLTDKIYCFGGITSPANTFVKQIVEYTPSTNTIVTKSAVLPYGPWGMRSMACAPSAVTGKIYCFGGYWLNNPNNNTIAEGGEIFEYNPATDTLVNKGDNRLPNSGGSTSNGNHTGRYWMSCADYPTTDKIYCFGGYNELGSGSGYHNDILEYTPATDTLVVKSTVLPSATAMLACAYNPGSTKIYCFGGQGFSGYDGTKQVFVYDAAANTITSKVVNLPANIPSNLGCASVAADKLYCFAGVRNASNQVFEYQPPTNTVTTRPVTFPSARGNLSCAPSATGKIYCFGGTVVISNAWVPNIRDVAEYTPN